MSQDNESATAGDATPAAAPKPHAPPANGGGTATASNKPGAPSDALAGLQEALVKAAKTSPKDESDPHVSDAFALGWQMAELYRPEHRNREEVDNGDLPGLSSLSSDARLGILVDQVQVNIARLRTAISEAAKPSGPEAPASELEAVRESLPKDEQTRENSVRALHRTLLGALTAADYRLGKAYGLGRALADTCRKPTSPGELEDELEDHRIANLSRWLDDLSSAFPPHAAHGVQTSLQRWVQWAPGNAQQDGDRAVRALRRQGELWRALLSAEKRGTEMLEIDNYLDAARQLATTTRTIVRGVIRRFPGLAILVVILLVGGIALLATGSGSQHLVAGATSVIAALGLSWKTLGSTVGGLAGKLEQPLYGALLDQAITEAITLLPNNKADYHDRRALALLTPPAP